MLGESNVKQTRKCTKNKMSNRKEVREYNGRRLLHSKCKFYEKEKKKQDDITSMTKIKGPIQSTDMTNIGMRRGQMVYIQAILTQLSVN